jgi:hypothetical protein
LSLGGTTLVLNFLGGSETFDVGYTFPATLNSGTNRAVVDMLGSPYNPTQNAPWQRGKFTALLPAASATDPNVPAGTGFAKIAILSNGSVFMTGKLADGTPFSQGASLITPAGSSAVPEFPLFPALSSNSHEALGGMITFATGDSNNKCTGSLSWTKTKRSKARLYPDGFATTLNLVGTRYIAPPPGGDALKLKEAYPNATVSLSEPDFRTTISKKVDVFADPFAPFLNDVFVLNPRADGLTMTIDSSAGVFSGYFVHPVTHSITPVQGALSQKTNTAGGFFLGRTQSGAITLSP